MTERAASWIWESSAADGGNRPSRAGCQLAGSESVTAAGRMTIATTDFQSLRLVQRERRIDRAWCGPRPVVRMHVPAGMHRCLHCHVLVQGKVTSLGNVVDALRSLRTRAQQPQVSSPSCADIDSRGQIGKRKDLIVARNILNVPKGVIVLRVLISIGTWIPERVVQLFEDVVPVTYVHRTSKRTTHRFAPTLPRCQPSRAS